MMETNHCLLEQFHALELLYRNQPIDVTAYDIDGNHVLSGKPRPVCRTCEFGQACPNTTYNIFRNPYITSQILETLQREGIVRFERRVTAQAEGETKRKLHAFSIALMQATDSEQTPVGYLMVCNDGSGQAGRKGIEEEELGYIRKSLEMSNIIIMRYDIATARTITLINGQYVQLTNEERKRCIHPDDLEAAEQLMENLISGKSDHETVSAIRLLPPGSDDYRYFKSDLSIIFNERGERTTVFANHYDVNEEYIKKMEVQKTQAILNMAISKTTLSVWTYETATHRYEQYTNNQFVLQKTAIQEKLADMDARDVEPFRKLVGEIISGKTENASFMTAMKKPDGRFFPVEYVLTAVHNEQGKVTHLLGITMDVSERVQREQALKEQRFMIELALNSYGVGIWRYDMAQRHFYGILDHHRMAVEGVSYEEFLRYLHPEYVETYTHIFRELEEGRKETENCIVAFISPQGETCYTQNAFAVLHDASGQAVAIVGVARDVTEELLKQRELQQYKINTGLVNDVSHIIYWNYDLATQLISAQGRVLHKDGAPMSKAEYMHYVHPADREKVNDLFDALDRKETSYPEFEIRSILPQQEGYRYMSVYVAPVKDSAGNIIGYTGIRRDVTEEKEHQRGLELMNNQLNLVLKMSHILPFLWYPERGLFYIQNREIKDSYDVFVKGASEMSYEDVIANNHPDNRAEVIRLLEDVRSGKVTKGWCKTRYDSKHRFESTFIVSLFSNPSRSEGEELYFIGFMHDVTNDEQMMQQLVSAKLKAEESDRLKSAFLANMSHEIRTPLNAIVGFSDLLLEADEQEDKKLYSSIISKNSQLLLQLVNDIIELARMEAGRIERLPELFNLNELLETSYNMHKGMAKNSNVKVLLDIPEEPYTVNWDKRRTMELLNNFISNAEKYTENGHIKIGFKELPDNVLKVFVEDTGCGIAKENVKKVFDRFEKLESFKQGAGLGMAICQSYVKAAGGKIGVDSDVNKGSTFWVLMPPYPNGGGKQASA